MSPMTGRYMAAVKRLSTVETDPSRSNQHELNGSSALRQLLGTEPRRGFLARWLILRDDGEPVVEEHACSWYDSRENHLTRSEWRLYYRGDPPLCAGDLMVCLSRGDTGEVVFLIAPSDSSWARQLGGLFGTPMGTSDAFVVAQFEHVLPSHQIVADTLFELLGWLELTTPALPSDTELMQERFGDGFPSTRVFSALARELVGRSSANADELLIAWWQREEALFRAFEELLLRGRLSTTPPFSGVEDFLQFSLSVQNRRKSRAGMALENHVEALLDMRELRFTRHARTEGDRRPDFLLPGAAAYHDQAFPAHGLTVLATKTSCKDRWRQVLNEAARIPTKHLLTLEPGISKAQLGEMHDEQVVLVAPVLFQESYDCPDGMDIMSVSDFLELATERQRQFSG